MRLKILEWEKSQPSVVYMNGPDDILGKKPTTDLSEVRRMMLLVFYSQQELNWIQMKNT